MATPAAAASATSVTDYNTDSVRSTSTTYQGAASLQDVSIAGDFVPDESFTMVPLKLPSSKRTVYLSPLGSETAQHIASELKAKSIGRVILLEQRVNPEFVSGVNSALTFANEERLQVEKVEMRSPEHIEGIPNLVVMKQLHDFTHGDGRNAWILGPDRTLVAVCLWLLENPKIQEIGKAFEIISKEINVSQLPQGQLQTFLDRLNGRVDQEDEKASVGVRRPSLGVDDSASISAAYQAADTGSSEDEEERVHQKGIPQGQKSKLASCFEGLSSCWGSLRQWCQKTAHSDYNAVPSPRRQGEV